MRMYNNHRTPAWAEGMIKLVQHYGKKVKFISDAQFNQARTSRV